MGFQDQFVPGSAIGDKELPSGLVGLNTCAIQYFRRSDGKLITPTLPMTEGHANNGALAVGATMTIVTPAAGKRLWVFKMFLGNNGDQKWSLKWSDGTWIKYNENAITPAPYTDYMNWLPYGILAPAINLSLQVINRSAA